MTEKKSQKSALGGLISRRLAATGETQGDFATRAGISKGAVSGYVSGAQRAGWFKTGQLERLAAALDLTPSQVALARIADLGYLVTEEPFSEHETIALAMIREVDDAEKDRILRVIRAAMRD